MPVVLTAGGRCRRAALIAILLLAAGCTGGNDPASTIPTVTVPTTPGGRAVTPPTGPAAAGWSTYQNGNARLGVAPAQPGLAPLTPLWTAPLDGQAVYGQPLVVGDRVIVATEGDDVYALDLHTGAVEWKTSIGEPLRGVHAQAGCGNVDPLGITSTPVIDTTSGLVYVVGETSARGSAPVHHMLVAMDLSSGQEVARADADPALPAGEDPVQLLQRPALALADKQLYIGYGGQYGDCGTYHGWVVRVRVPVAGVGGTSQSFDVTPESTGGAVWGAGAGPSISARGRVYVTTGNPNSPGSAPWAEAVLELAPSLSGAPLAVFQDRAATDDLDLATGTPVLLPDGDLFVVGKTDIGYLLAADGLGLVAAIHGICGSDPDGGAAFDSALDALYVPCRDGGIQQILLSSRRVGWRAGDVNSTPILAGGSLWAAGYPSGVIEELAPATGRTMWKGSAGRRVPTFVSMSAVDGVALVPTTAGVEAFRGGGS